MNFDFENDFRVGIYKDFDLLGVKYQNSTDFDRLLIDYFTILKKIIFPIKRKVIVSPTLLLKLEDHPKKKEIFHVKILFEKGYNVNCFQNKRLFQTNFHDHLVYEWNIYHLHLSIDRYKNTSFVKQVKQLLFVFITDYEAIFLDTDNHVEGTFADPKWIEILHDYFPEFIVKNKMDHINDIKPILTPKERQVLWDKGYSTSFMKIRNTIYCSFGIARSTTGHANEVVNQSNEIQRWLFYVKDQFHKLYFRICKTIDVDADKAKFKLTINSGVFEIIELVSQRKILKFNEYIDENKLVG